MTAKKEERETSFGFVKKRNLLLFFHPEMKRTWGDVAYDLFDSVAGAWFFDSISLE